MCGTSSSNLNDVLINRTATSTGIDGRILTMTTQGRIWKGRCSPRWVGRNPLQSFWMLVQDAELDKIGVAVPLLVEDQEYFGSTDPPGLVKEKLACLLFAEQRVMGYIYPRRSSDLHL